MRIKLESIEKKYDYLYLSRMYSISCSDLLDIVAQNNPEFMEIINSKESVDSKIDSFLSLNVDYSFDFVAISDNKILKESMMMALREILFKKDSIDVAEFSTTLSVKNELYKLFNNHILSYSHDLFLFQDLAKKYPQYMYTGVAYRFVHTTKYNESSVAGKCFSLNKEGILFFTENSNFLNGTIVKHNILGFNVIRFLHDHENEIVELNFKTESDYFKKEQEIIAFEDLGLIESKQVATRPELVEYLKNSL